jgi:hypothetical protein
MRRYFYVLPLITLITTLTSFGFVAAILISQVGEDSYFSATQLNAVIAICIAATLSSLGLLTLVVFELIEKRLNPKLYQTLNKVVVVIGLIFCSLAVGSFFLVPTDFYEDFLLKFTHSARFEFLMLGVSALIMPVVRRIAKTPSQ